MIGSFLIGIGGIVILMITWIGIQSLWRLVFADHLSDEDAMADRTRCTNCGCTTLCKNKDTQ